jgi:hypothetical protein
MLEQLLVQIIQMLNIVVGTVLPPQISQEQKNQLQLVIPVLYAALKYPATHFAGQSSTPLDNVTVAELIEIIEEAAQKYGIELS